MTTKTELRTRLHQMLDDFIQPGTTSYMLDLEDDILTLLEDTVRERLTTELRQWADFFDDPSMDAMSPTERLNKRINEIEEKS